MALQATNLETPMLCSAWVSNKHIKLLLEVSRFPFVLGKHFVLLLETYFCRRDRQIVVKLFKEQPRCIQELPIL